LQFKKTIYSVIYYNLGTLFVPCGSALVGRRRVGDIVSCAVCAVMYQSSG